jgi:hypothetical protein
MKQRRHWLGDHLHHRMLALGPLWSSTGSNRTRSAQSPRRLRCTLRDRRSQLRLIACIAPLRRGPFADARKNKRVPLILEDIIMVRARG